MNRLLCASSLLITLACSPSGGGGGTAGGAPFPTAGGFSNTGGGSGNGGGSAGGGSTSGGTKSCPWLVTCATNCSQTDQACLNACGAQATSTALAQYNALVDCTNTNNCQTDACVQQNCGAPLSACVGSTAMDGGTGSGGGSAGTCLPNTVGSGVTARAGADEFVTTITAVNGDRITSTVSTGSTVLATSEFVLGCSQLSLITLTDLLGSVITYTPPLDTLPSAFTVGHTNTATATTAIRLMGVTPCTGSMEKRYQVLANESVTVPAGTFQAVKFEVTSMGTTTCPNGYGGANATDTLWFAPGVGIIKTQSSTGSSEVIEIR